MNTREIVSLRDVTKMLRSGGGSHWVAMHVVELGLAGPYGRIRRTYEYYRDKIGSSVER